MTLVQSVGLSAAIFGAAGTAILFFNSYAFQPLQGAVFGSPSVTEANNHIKARNIQRRKWQLVGLGLLLLSFVIQGAASLL